MRGLIVSEASSQVGYGHLMESLTIVGSDLDKGAVTFALIKSDEAAFKLVRDSGYNVSEYREGVARYDWVFLNTRKNEYTLQAELYERTGRLIVLDELGGLPLKCHGLVNFSINSNWHNYSGDTGEIEFYLGADYYPLRSGLRKVKNTMFTAGLVLVTLGGADRSASVLRVAELLKEYEGACTYVLGPGCSVNADDLKKVDHHHDIVVVPDNFDELLSDCEFVISSGGNTLYETAFLCKKALVVWEDEHERVQGELFEKAGAAVVIGGPEGICKETLHKVLVENFKFNPCCIGIDGNGAERIYEVIGKNNHV